jgi:hypothetical protein
MPLTLLVVITVYGTRGHRGLQRGAALGAVKAASLRSAGAFRAASGLDRACAQRVTCICVMAATIAP